MEDVDQANNAPTVVQNVAQKVVDTVVLDARQRI